MIPILIPEDGDVVVRIVQVDARPSYVLSVVPGPGQFTYADRQEATARAAAYAERTGVNAWYAGPEDRFEVLGLRAIGHSDSTGTRPARRSSCR